MTVQGGQNATGKRGLVQGLPVMPLTSGQALGAGGLTGMRGAGGGELNQNVRGSHQAMGISSGKRREGSVMSAMGRLVLDLVN